MMNSFEDHGLDEDAFGEKSGNIVQAFDAFSKAKPQYVTRTSGGGKWTITVLIACLLLGFGEFRRWWAGYESHTFSVEKDIGHTLLINMDITVAMPCKDIHINVQDAAGDRVLAGDMLKRVSTEWSRWVNTKGLHRLGSPESGVHERHEEGFGEEHVHDIVGSAGKEKDFAKTPSSYRPWGSGQRGDACRVFGNLEVNKVQGDFHITARGHGYQDFSDHLEHKRFNFSHIISELSFGAFYPSLVNPLDHTISTTDRNFQKFQYFLSIVPTIYTLSSTPTSALPSADEQIGHNTDLSPLTHLAGDPNTVFTNQYAVTSQNVIVGERMVPGIFFKYDIEPLLLTVQERRDGFLKLFVKIVNLISGVLVAGHWGFVLSEWIGEVIGRRRRGERGFGVLDGSGKSGFSD